MKTYLLFIFSFLSVSQTFAQTVSKIVYDGVYIETAPNQFAKLNETNTYLARWRVDYVNQSAWANFRLTNEEKRVDLKSFKKIIFKGSSADEMKAMTIHPAQSVGRLYTVLYSETPDAGEYYTYKCESASMRTPIECRLHIFKVKDGYYEVTLPDGLKADATYVIWYKGKFHFFKSSSAVPSITVSAKVKTPKIMGAYLKDKTQMLTPLEITKAKTGQYSEYRKSCRCYTDIHGNRLSRDDDKMIEEKAITKLRNGTQSFNSTEIEAIVLKGHYDFNAVKIRQIHQVEAGGENKKSFVTREVEITEGKMYLVFAADTELNKITNGDECTFHLTKPLEKGDYSLNVGDYHWLFSVK